MSDTPFLGPVAVGGIGGSGTRIVASLIQELGFYIGSDLNKSMDNLWFTLLFKRPRWYISSDEETRSHQIHQALSIFEKAMTRGLQSRPNPQEADFVRRVCGEITSYPQVLGMGAGHRQVRSILRSQTPQECIGWGWKEPNTHVLLRHICPYFPSMKYIHVIRNGLDMAFSSNQKQLELWGSLYGCDAPRATHGMPRAALRYWVRANRAAVLNARRMLGKHFHVILFDDLCGNPRRHVSDLAAFLDRTPKPGEIDELASMVQAPSTIGRYREHDIFAILDSTDIAAVREFGFDPQGG